MSDSELHPLRTACRCGSLMGRITRKSSQDVVRCSACAAWQYNAPRGETGNDTDSVRTRHEISPSQRARILGRDNYRCILCGCAASNNASLHIGHLVSVHDADDYGLTSRELWHDENLAAMCRECNLGLGRRSVSARLIAALVVARTSQAGAA